MAGCKYCGGSDVEYSEARGESYCTKCGAVLEENRMVDSVSFAETSSGAMRAVGQFIPASFSGGGFAMSYGSRESREQALQRGYSNIQRIADRLCLPMTVVEGSQRVYMMAVQRGFTMGRISSHVAAACLYVTCRREKMSQLLIDFSDVLTVPVRALGAIFVKLLRVLHIHVPTVDPSLFMERFAAEMNLGDKTSLVAQTGVRLVQAMARDWICTGRRPTGLCGAALLIAARYHGIKINPEDISSTIRMSSSTVNKRLFEFSQTATAQISANEFETTNLLALPSADQPPCMLAAERKKRKLMLALEAAEETPQLDDGKNVKLIGKDNAQNAGKDGNVENNENVEDGKKSEGVQNSVTSVLGGIRMETNEEEICNSSPSAHAISSLAKKMVASISSQLTQQTVADTQDLLGSVGGSQTDGGEGEATPAPSGDESGEFGDPEDPLRDFLSDVQRKNLMDEILEDETTHSMNSLALVPVEPGNEEDLEGVETLSNISDSEVSDLILSAEEKAAKTLIWDELMKDVMPEVHRRMKERRRKNKLMATKQPKKRQRIEFEPAASAVDSVRMVMETKHKSVVGRLNEDSLQTLFSGSSADANQNTAYSSLFT